MSDYMYILIFIFAGFTWLGLYILGFIVYLSIEAAFTPAPKPTAWEQEWQEIERNLSK